MYKCPWYFKNEVFDSQDLQKGYFSFIYVITDLKNNKKYIGQKMFYAKKPVTKNKITKKVTVESDWKDYFSSSEKIKSIVKEEGFDFIKREIIYICFSKGQANYLETKLQIELGCLESPDDWYNGITNCKVHHTHLRLDKLIDTDKSLLESLYLKYRKSPY